MIPKPLGARIVATPEQPEAKTASGIVLANAAVKKPFIAEIVAIGPDVEHLEIGNRIIYKAADTTPITIDGTELIIINEGEVLGTV